MKQILIAIAESLMAVADARVKEITRELAVARAYSDEDYTTNAGGWN